MQLTRASLAAQLSGTTYLSLVLCVCCSIGGEKAGRLEFEVRQASHAARFDGSH